MDYLQYQTAPGTYDVDSNTVLNLIINGLPSIFLDVEK